jgi:hypothetical protein
MDEVQQGLRYLFQTDSKYVLCVSGTGHAGMECAIANLTEPGDTVVVGNKGIWVSGGVGGWEGGRRAWNGFFSSRVTDVRGNEKEHEGGTLCLYMHSVPSLCGLCIPSNPSPLSLPPHPPALMLAHAHGRTVHPQGARVCDMAERFGNNVVELKKDAGRTFTFEELKQAVEKNKPSVLFLCQVCGMGVGQAVCAVAGGGGGGRDVQEGG